MRNCLDQALELGFSKAALLTDLSLDLKPELRAYCTPQQCSNHGQNWVCPPGCGSLADCQTKAKAFNMGVLLQSTSVLTPPTEEKEYRRLNHVHNIRFKAFIGLVKPSVAKLLPLTTGGCIFCERCTYPESCVKPDVKMESLSAFGIDVGGLCEAAGLPYSFCNNRVYYMALLLFKRLL